MALPPPAGGARAGAARSLVLAWGADTLAPFVLRADKSYFFSEDERAFLAYRVVGGVAVVSGDPIGPPSEFDLLVERFIAFATSRDWRIAILGASERCLDLYRVHGLHALYHGDEAVIDDGSFSLDGPADPQGAPVRPPAERLRLHVHGAVPARDRAGAAWAARGDRAGLARRGRPAGS